MRITIKNFQPFADVSLDVEGLTVIVGPSNRGKSALIRAVEGALFNRPGDGSIRVGAKSAVVTIEGLPNGPQTLVWTKARSTSYRIDGETFGKLSGDTPPVLQQVGYRDLWIGDKDRKKGEYLRPQVATQFEPLFLLTRSGSFLADVLNRITRQQVLTLAQDRCAGDLRSVKQRLGLAETARVQVAARVAALQDVPAFLQRMQALHVKAEACRQEQGQRDRVAGLVQARQTLQGLQTGLVAALDWPPAAAAYSRLHERQYRAALVRARLALAQVPALPEARSLPQWAGIVRAVTRREQLVRLLALRRQLRTIPMTLPAPTVFSVAWDQTAVLRAHVVSLVAERDDTLARLQQCEAALSAATAEVDQLDAQLHDQLDALALCPLCERPMETAHAESV